ncbi:M28 family peptidase [Marinoscillum pacificum]|uniref:M28 family peptidase n=1 Tax=Marinoscillum pacificum TaxID=392723 RepID=UPI002156F926|nr:M28 family peptidase [Marinoscillum pacificum]
MRILQIGFTFLSILFSNISLANESDTTIIRQHLTAITKTDGFRNYRNLQLLNQTADYIQSVFSQFSEHVSIQEYEVGSTTYKNVIASFGMEHKKRIIVGAHYDVCGNQQGADDNASGVVGLLELARLLVDKELSYGVDLVAYTLEEPPYFRTEFMVSYIHAKSLVDEGADVLGMISVEMIGYFKEEKNTQSYPLGILSAIYGSRGNYITLVKKFGAGKFVRQFSRKFKSTKAIRTKMFAGPKRLTGIDFSDHLNYWKFGFKAMMITDTSFYRNANYHAPTDTMETLDIGKMSQVIDGLCEALLTM